MTVLGRPVLPGPDCRHVLHPETDDCLLATFTYVMEGIVGATRFFALMYLAELIIRRKKLSKEEIPILLKNFLRSVSFAILYGVGFGTPICLQSRCLGTLEALPMDLLSSFISSTSIFVSPPFRRVLESTSFGMVAVEAITNVLVSRGIAPKGQKYATVYFMALNAALMYLSWVQSESKTINIKWFYKPISCREDDKSAQPKRNISVQRIAKVVMNYFSIGLAFSTFKTLVANRRNLGNGIWKLSRRSNFRLAACLACYVGIFEVSRKLLRGVGEETGGTVALSGLLAGSSYLLHPSPAYPASALTILITSIWGYLKDKSFLPDIDYTEISFIISNMVVLCVGFRDIRLVPRTFENFFRLAQIKRSVRVFDLMRESQKIHRERKLK